MEKALDQVIIAASSVLILVTCRICFDLIVTLWKDYELNLVWLTVMFTSFIMVGIGGLIAINLLSIPIVLKTGMAITLILAALGTYNTLQGLRK